MKALHVVLFSSLFCFAGLNTASAQAFKYTPKNPAFGGSSFNYSWLLSAAQAQDTYKDPNASSFDFNFDEDPLESFSDNLNRQLLSRISQDIFARQFGDAGLTEGTFKLGDFQVEIVEAGDGLSITLLDILKGGETQVFVPFF